MAQRAPIVVVPHDTERLTPRLAHLLLQQDEPVELGWGIQCLRDGGSEAAAAMKSGLTPAEWRQVKAWGAGDHPAFREFYREYLFAKGMALEEVQHKVHAVAVEDGGLLYAKAAEEIILDGRMGGERGEGGSRTQVNVVINKDFDG